MTRVVDTSVVLKWIVHEENSEAAQALIGEDLLAPDLLKAELANALWKRVLRKDIDALQAASGFTYATSLLSFTPAASFAERALEIGLTLKHPIYDCFFLALTEFLDGTLVTSDRRLANRCAGTGYARLIELL